MNLQCDIGQAAGYKSRSQIARILTEDWCARELYCPSCPGDRLTPVPTNTEAIDFHCSDCREPFQLKSANKWGLTKVVDAGYAAMLRAIRADKTPNLLLLHYSDAWRVEDLLLVPRFFFSKSCLERRKPLSETARRAGWVGCNILLTRIPDDGKIEVIGKQTPVSRQRVREEFERARQLSNIRADSRGWTIDVLNVVRRLPSAHFSLTQAYESEDELQALHPENRNVRPKIRQQLQVLRDLGFIKFLSPGRYLRLA